jgi:hypothetical protein
LSRSAIVAFFSMRTTQTLAWGSSYYLPAILAKPIAEGLGLSRALVFGGLLSSMPTGGNTLSFCGIRLELKSDNERPLRLADCERFIGQTASSPLAAINASPFFAC